MKKLFVFLVLAVSLVFLNFFLGIAFAQTTHAIGERIVEFADTIIIEKDGSIQVTERIAYDFGTNNRHGIFRTIPYIKTNSENKRFKLTMQNMSIVDERNNAYPFVQTYENDTLTIKIGDANKTISGLHTYIISYTVSGALTYYSDHDELYWNITGNDWNVPIQKASAIIQLPTSTDSSSISHVCYTGEKESTRRECTASFAKGNALFATNMALPANQGFTIVVGSPKGIVSVLEPTEEIPFYQTTIGKLFWILTGIFAFIWYIAFPATLVWRWFRYGRDPKPLMGPAKAWFSAPTTENGRPLTPGETGALHDETVDLRDIFATVVDLARRGYLKIIETKKNTFRFDKTKEYLVDPDVQPFERKLLSGIFDTFDSVLVQSLDIAGTITDVKNTLYSGLVSEKFFPRDPQKVRSLYSIFAFLAFTTFNPLLLVASVIFGRHMPKKTLLGAGQAAVALSLKRFLVSQEKQLAFQAKNQMMFEKLLPYAIAFGVEKIWAERFKNMSLKSPDWYEGYNGGTFNSILLVNSLQHSYTSVARATTPTSSSSGFSSGFSGGSSGGGGGGGGGGSW